MVRRAWARRTAASLCAGPSTIATWRLARGLSNRVAAPASASLSSTAVSSLVRAPWMTTRSMRRSGTVWLRVPFS